MDFDLLEGEWLRAVFRKHGHDGVKGDFGLGEVGL
jgi:hypothetical protein